MYRRALTLACVLAFPSLAPAQADPDAGDFGVGVMLGEPSGVSAKYWISETEAVSGGLAYSIAGHDAMQVHADYLIHHFDVTRIDESDGRLPVYFGIGGRFKLAHDEGRGKDDDARLGVRLPLGITFLFAHVPFDVFGEVAPIIDVIPEADLGISLAFGARLYFGGAPAVAEPIDSP
jgi:hypothetical protein